MKLNLLLVATLLTGATFAQFTQSNEPQVGNTKTLYVVDSNATDYAAVTGTGVTWDYSTIGTYSPSVSKIVSVLAAPSTGNFTAANYGVEIPNFITGYYTSTASARNSIGFTYNDPNGDIEVVLDTDDELVMNYPFAVSNTLTDAFSGNVYTTMSPLPFPVTGTANATVDGSGTLKLEGQDFTNVLRYKITESGTITAPLGTFTMDRTQYEYYDLANSTLPIFIHTSLTINTGTATTQTLVLSSVLPTGLAKINASNAIEFTVYPNPAKDVITLSGLSGGEMVQLVDLSGKTVLSIDGLTSNTIDVSTVEAGIYNLVIVKNNNKSFKKISIQ